MSIITFRQPKNPFEPRGDWTDFDLKRFADSIYSAESKNELKMLLEDLFTEKELELFSKRMKAVFMIFFGANYVEVTQITGLRSQAISRISKIMRYKWSGLNNAMRRLYPKGYDFEE